jgi:hypothetical protein
MTITDVESSSETVDPLSPTVNSQNLEEAGENTEVETAEVNNDDDDDVTVIILEHGLENQNHSGWADQNSPDMEQRTSWLWL